MRSPAQLVCISTFASVLFTATFALIASFFQIPRRSTPTSHTLVSGSLQRTISNSFGPVRKCSIPHINACTSASQQITGSNDCSALYIPAGAADRSHALVSLPVDQSSFRSRKVHRPAGRLQRRLICSAAGLGGCLAPPKTRSPL
jgi:hypothetical protein